MNPSFIIYFIVDFLLVAMYLYFALAAPSVLRATAETAEPHHTDLSADDSALIVDEPRLDTNEQLEEDEAQELLMLLRRQVMVQSRCQIVICCCYCCCSLFAFLNMPSC